MSRMTVFDERASEALRAIGVEEPTQDEINHMAVLIHAFRIYQEREGEYGAMWKESGFVRNMQDVDGKVARIKRGLTMNVIRDSTVDAINYAIFHLLNKEAGRS